MRCTPFGCFHFSTERFLVRDMVDILGCTGVIVALSDGGGDQALVQFAHPLTFQSVQWWFPVPVLRVSPSMTVASGVGVPADLELDPHSE